MRKAMVERTHPQLSVRRQCELLDVNRNRLPEEPTSEALVLEKIEENEAMEPTPMLPEEVKRVIAIRDLYAKHPEFGRRRMAICLTRMGIPTTPWEARRWMKIMRLKAIYRRPRTTIPDPKARKYAYLLRDMKVTLPDQVWCTDITFIPVGNGFVYLIAIMDWYTRAVLAWRVSNTMDTHFCVEALEEALRTTGRVPQVMNTDQGSQFTSEAWIKAVESRGIKVSMDGKGRWMDNVYIERLWRSVKHEGVFMWEIQTIAELKKLLKEWFESYNRFKPHQAHGGLTPWEVYRPEDPKPWKDVA